MIKIILMLLVPVLLTAQTKIKVIAVIGEKITRVEGCSITITDCQCTDLLWLEDETMNAEMEAVVSEKKDGEEFYYLISKDRTIAVAMIRKVDIICKTFTWFDGIPLSTVYLRKFK